MLPAGQSQVENHNKKQSICKNHTTQQGNYYLTDQPWIKYCRNCALNAALCGRKIQKQLTNSQFNHKMQLSSIINEFKSSLVLVEKNKEMYNQLVETLQQSSTSLSGKISQIEAHVNALLESKKKLEKMYEQEITDKISNYLEKQGKIVMLTNKFKSEMQKIECNFTELISLENQAQFEQKISCLSELSLAARQQLIKEEDYQYIKEQTSKIKDIFYSEMQEITKKTLTFDFGHEKSQKTQSSNESVDMTLTPVQNSLVASIANKCGRLRLRSNRRNQNCEQRQSLTAIQTIFPSKRQSLCSGERYQRYQEMLNRKKQ